MADPLGIGATDIDHVGIAVRDLEAAVEHYRMVLGTEPVHREVMERYKIDGVFINRWAGSGMCYCEHCRTNFRAATGHELPRTDDPHDPARRAYIAWHQERLFELFALLESASAFLRS